MIVQKTLAEQESRAVTEMFVVLSDIWLDHEEVLSLYELRCSFTYEWADLDCVLSQVGQRSQIKNIAKKEA